MINKIKKKINTYSREREIDYVIYLLNQILEEPKPPKNLSRSGFNNISAGDSVKEMYRKLHESVSINIPTIIKLLSEIKK